jgi:hypothetical protein
MKLRSRETPTIAAAKAGYSAAPAHRFEGDGRLPFERKAPRGRRCSDPLAGIWEKEICADDLGNAGIAGAIAEFEEIQGATPNSRPASGEPWNAASGPGVRDRGAARATVTLFRGPERPSSADTNTGAGR